MLLIVNTWLGFPYIMVLCSGLIKAIPADLYEASAMAGAKPLTNFFAHHAPLILKPLTPLLISAFAFNFNNFVLISLLTDGRPDTSTPSCRPAPPTSWSATPTASPSPTPGRTSAWRRRSPR
jgi:ABC-type sugar transport system permease subunit